MVRGRHTYLVIDYLQTVRIVKLKYQENTAHLPSSRRRGFLRGSSYSSPLISLAPSWGVSFTSEVPSPVAEVSISFPSMFPLRQSPKTSKPYDQMLISILYPSQPQLISKNLVLVSSWQPRPQTDYWIPWPRSTAHTAPGRRWPLACKVFRNINFST